MNNVNKNSLPAAGEFTRRFHRKSSAEQVTDGMDLSGRTIVVTGVNSGLGQESMRVLAMRGAHVIGLARSQEKATQACAEVAGQVTPIACELSDFDSVRRAAQSIRALDQPIDVLMCNAGIMALREHRKRYNLELQFVTNHLGHLLLINELLDSLRDTKGRIVITSSAGHTHTPKGGIDFANLSGDAGYNAWQAYGQSKLANILCAKSLAKRLASRGITVNSLHPGVIQTNLARSTGGLMTSVIQLVAPLFGRTVGQGAATQVYLAVHPDVAAQSGEYFADCALAKPSLHARDDELAERLWQVSEDLLLRHS